MNDCFQSGKKFQLWEQLKIYILIFLSPCLPRNQIREKPNFLIIISVRCCVPRLGYVWYYDFLKSYKKWRRLAINDWGQARLFTRTKYCYYWRDIKKNSHNHCCHCFKFLSEHFAFSICLCWNFYEYMYNKIISWNSVTSSIFSHSLTICSMSIALQNF